MKVRILRVPPSQTLEGVDVGPYGFERGRIYDVDDHVARVLVVWSYAERIGEGDHSNHNTAERRELRRR